MDAGPADRNAKARHRWRSTSWLLAAALALGCSVTSMAAPQDPSPPAEAEAVHPLDAAIERAREAASDSRLLLAWRDNATVNFWDLVSKLHATGDDELVDAIVALPESPRTRGLAAYVALLRRDDASAEALELVETYERSETPDGWDLENLEQLSADGPARMRAAALNLLARHALTRKEFANAAQRYAEAAVLAVDSLDHVFALDLWRAAAVNWRRGGRLVRARTAEEGVLASATFLEDQPMIAISQMNLGNYNGQIGDFRASLDWFTKAQQGFEALGDQPRLQRVLANRAFLYRLLGRYKEALSTYEQLLAEMPDEPSPQRTRVISDLAELSLTLGDGERALDLARRALAQTPKGDVAARALRHGVLARALQETGDAEAALLEYGAAEKLFREAKDLRGEQIAIANAAYLHYELERYELARPLSSTALELADRMGDAYYRVNARQNLALVLLRSGEVEQALKLQQEAHEMAEQHSLLKLIRDGHRGLAEVYRATGNLDLAIDHGVKAVRQTSTLLAGLTSELAARAREEHFDAFDVGLTLLVIHGANDDGSEASQRRIETALELMERSRGAALLLALENRAELRDALVPERLREAEEEAKKAIDAKRAEFEAALGGEAPADGTRGGKRRVSLKAVRASRSALESALAALEQVRATIRVEAALAAQLMDPQPPSLETLTAELSDDQAYVGYVVVSDGVAALVVHQGKARWVQLGESEPIDKACEALSGGGDESWETATANLRKLVVEPLGLPDTVRRLLVSPDGSLIGTPLAMAVGARDYVQVPSAAAWLHLRQSAELRGEGVLAIGGPDYTGRRLETLPGAVAEVKAVGTEVHTGADATEATLREAISKDHRWRALHLACHGLVDTKHPMRSYLALTADDEDDGALSAEEVLDLELRTDVAVLSACETGRGKTYRGEGLTGLMSSFLYAGAPRVICSLWKVPDDSTSALMKAFHRELGAGATAATALRKAQAEVRAKPEWAHPEHWAAWTLWGVE